MNHPFYIKMVYGSLMPGDRPWREGEDDYLHFREEQQALCDRFAGATGFLVYETKHSRGENIGAQTIFAKGSIESLGCENVQEHRVEDDYGNRYPLGVKVRFEKIVPAAKGIALGEIYRLCPRLDGQLGMPARGGVIGITLEEYEALSESLNMCK